MKQLVLYLPLLRIRKVVLPNDPAGTFFRVEVPLGDTGLPPYEPIVGVDFVTRDSLCELLTVIRGALVAVGPVSPERPSVSLDACGRPTWPGIEHGAPNPYSRSEVAPAENPSKAGGVDSAAFGGGGNAELARPQPWGPATGATISVSTGSELPKAEEFTAPEACPKTGSGCSEQSPDGTGTEMPVETAVPSTETLDCWDRLLARLDAPRETLSSPSGLQNREEASR